MQALYYLNLYSNRVLGEFRGVPVKMDTLYFRSGVSKILVSQRCLAAIPHPWPSLVPGEAHSPGPEPGLQGLRGVQGGGPGGQYTAMRGDAGRAVAGELDDDTGGLCS